MGLEPIQTDLVSAVLPTTPRLNREHHSDSSTGLEPTPPGFRPGALPLRHLEPLAGAEGIEPPHNALTVRLSFQRDIHPNVRRYLAASELLQPYSVFNALSSYSGARNRTSINGFRDRCPAFRRNRNVVTRSCREGLTLK